MSNNDAQAKIFQRVTAGYLKTVSPKPGDFIPVDDREPKRSTPFMIASAIGNVSVALVAARFAKREGKSVETILKAGIVVGVATRNAISNGATISNRSSEKRDPAARVLAGIREGQLRSVESLVIATEGFTTRPTGPRVLPGAQRR